MRRTAMISLMLVLVAALIATPIIAKVGTTCTTIKDGTLLASTGETLVVGYDEFGYNYQAHMFNGRYCDYLRQDPPPDYLKPYCGVHLIMKWNDAWLSNKDCDGDGVLDRPANYIGSGAWCTNHMRGEDENGEWTYFVKIVAVPEDAVLDEVSGIWYAADGTMIGPQEWGAFAVIQQVESGLGATYVSPCGPGLGKW